MAKKEVGLEERHLSLSEAADALDISERTAYRWIKSGKLRAYKPGRDYWIPESAIRVLVEESKVRPKVESRSSLEPKLFNNGLEEERRLPIAVAAVSDAAEKWRTTVSNPDARPYEISAAVDAALVLSEALAEQVDDPSAEHSPEQWEAIRLASRLLEISKVGNDRILNTGEEEQYRARRDQIREMTRRISA
jgi:excisionase family DNA binding protein